MDEFQTYITNLELSAAEKCTAGEAGVGRVLGQVQSPKECSPERQKQEPLSIK